MKNSSIQVEVLLVASTSLTMLDLCEKESAKNGDLSVEVQLEQAWKIRFPYHYYSCCGTAGGDSCWTFSKRIEHIKSNMKTSTISVWRELLLRICDNVRKKYPATNGKIDFLI